MNGRITVNDINKQTLEILDSLTYAMIDMCGSKVKVSDTKDTLIEVKRKINRLYIDSVIGGKIL